MPKKENKMRPESPPQKHKRKPQKPIHQKKQAAFGYGAREMDKEAFLDEDKYRRAAIINELEAMKKNEKLASLLERLRAREGGPKPPPAAAGSGGGGGSSPPKKPSAPPPSAAPAPKPKPGGLWRSLQAKGPAKQHMLGRAKIIKAGSSNESLNALAVDMYNRGLIREEVMGHAVKQAAMVKVSSLGKSAGEMIGKRAAIFGANTPLTMKLAFFGKQFKEDNPGLAALAEGALKPLGALGVAAAVKGLSWLTDSTKADAERSWQQLMIENPEFERDRESARKHFEVLLQFAPGVATNPTAAAGHIRQAIEMGNIVPVDTIRNLAQTEKLYQESGPQSWMK
jgi:hypothetical protein